MARTTTGLRVIMININVIVTFDVAYVDDVEFC